MVSSEVPADHSLRHEARVLELCSAVRRRHVYQCHRWHYAVLQGRLLPAAGIDLKFIRSKPFEYPQGGSAFVPWLSIVDVMMFNSAARLREVLESGMSSSTTPRDDLRPIAAKITTCQVEQTGRVFDPRRSGDAAGSRSSRRRRRHCCSTTSCASTSRAGHRRTRTGSSPATRPSWTWIVPICSTIRKVGDAADPPARRARRVRRVRRLSRFGDPGRRRRRRVLRRAGRAASPFLSTSPSVRPVSVDGGETFTKLGRGPVLSLFAGRAIRPQRPQDPPVRRSLVPVLHCRAQVEDWWTAGRSRSTRFAWRSSTTA